jgi:hypothetical protein
MPALLRRHSLESADFTRVYNDELASLCIGLPRTGNGSVLILTQQPIWLARNQRTINPPGTPSIHAMKYFMPGAVAS